MNIPSNNLGALLGNVTRMMRRAFQATYQQTENCSLTLTQARALIGIARHQGLKQFELAEILEIKPITVARLIDVLCDAGLVERRQDAKDKRAFKLFLTDAAKPHLDEIDRAALIVYAQALKGFDEVQAKAILCALTQMHKNLSL